MNKLKVVAVSAEGVRLVDEGRAPDVLVKTRLLSKKHSTSLPTPTAPGTSQTSRASPFFIDMLLDYTYATWRLSYILLPAPPASAAR
jgi:hypothetical protein